MAKSMEHYRGHEVAMEQQQQGAPWQAVVTDRDGTSRTTGRVATYGEALADAKRIVDEQIPDRQGT